MGVKEGLSLSGPMRAPAVEGERNTTVLKALATKAYHQKVKARTKGEEVYVSPGDVLEQARATHGRNMLQLSDAAELRRRQNAAASMVRLQAEDYVVRTRDPLLHDDSNEDDDCEDDAKQQCGVAMQRRGGGASTTAPTSTSGEGGNGGGPAASTAPRNTGADRSRRGRRGSTGSASGVSVADLVAAAVSLGGPSGPQQGRAARQLSDDVHDSDDGSVGDGGDEDAPYIVNVLVPSDDEDVDDVDEEAEDADGSGVTTGALGGAAAAGGTADGTPTHPSSTSVDGSKSRAENLISQLRQFQKASGPQPPRYRSSVSGLPLEPSVRADGAVAADYTVRSGRQFGATTPLAPPQTREPLYRASVLSGTGSGSPVPALVPPRDASPMLRPPAAPGSPLYAAAGGADPSVRFRRASAVGLPGGAAPAGSESPVAGGSAASFVGGVRPQFGRISAVDAVPRSMIAGLSDKSVHSLRTASATAMERPSLLSTDSGVHAGGTASGGASSGGGSPVAPVSVGMPRTAGDKSVRNRRASVLIASSSYDNLPAAAGSGSRPPATADPSVRSGLRTSATADFSVRAGVAGGSRSQPGGGESASAPVGHLPDLVGAPVGGPAVSLFRAITGAEPVGRSLPPAPPPGDAPEVSAKSIRALQAQAQLLQLQQMMGAGMGAALGMPAVEVAAAVAAGQYRHMSSSQVECVSRSGPSATKLPKIGTSVSGGAFGSAAGPVVKRASTDGNGLGALRQVGRAAGNGPQPSHDDDDGIVSKVKGLFHILKR